MEYISRIKTVSVVLLYIHLTITVCVSRVFAFIRMKHFFLKLQPFLRQSNLANIYKLLLMLVPPDNEKSFVILKMRATASKSLVGLF